MEGRCTELARESWGTDTTACERIAKNARNTAP